MERSKQIYSFCLVTDCPPTREATERSMNMIGPFKNTHYGDLRQCACRSTADLEQEQYMTLHQMQQH